MFITYNGSGVYRFRGTDDELEYQGLDPEQLAAKLFAEILGELRKRPPLVAVGK